MCISSSPLVILYVHIQPVWKNNISIIVAYKSTKQSLGKGFIFKGKILFFSRLKSYMSKKKEIPITGCHALCLQW